MPKLKIIIGIDEAGRGPLAGPITVAAVAAKPNSKVLKGIKNSKKLSPKRREELNRILRKNFECRYVSINNKVIDKIGIQKATGLAVRLVLNKLTKNHKVLLDGSLKAPKHYNQKTIIKGDEKIPIIAAASIIAKVSRDRKMLRFHKKYPKYGFDRHKGYGTKKHIRAIRKFKLSPIHRKTFKIKS